MVRRVFLTMAFALWSLAAVQPAWADITVLVPSGSEGDGLRAAAADYSKLKGTKVEIVQAPYNNVFEQAANAGQTKSGAFDIVLMDDPWIPFFAENGHLEDLTPYFKKAGKDRAGQRLPVQVAGAVPQSLQQRALCLPALCRQCTDVLLRCHQVQGGGCRRTEDLGRRAEGGKGAHRQAAAAATSAMSSAAARAIRWSPTSCRSSGPMARNLFNEDRTKVTIDTPEGAAAMKTFMALRDVSPKGVESYNANEVGQALAAGTAASSINWPNWVATFEDPSAVAAWSARSPTPAIPAGTNAGSSEIGHWTMGIMSAAKNKQEAFDFMVWATSPEQIKISADARQPAGAHLDVHRSGADQAGQVPALSRC